MIIYGSKDSGISLTDGVFCTYHGKSFHIEVKFEDLRAYLVAYYSGLPLPTKPIACRALHWGALVGHDAIIEAYEDSSMGFLIEDEWIGTITHSELEALREWVLCLLVEMKIAECL